MKTIPASQVSNVHITYKLQNNIYNRQKNNISVHLTLSWNGLDRQMTFIFKAMFSGM